MASYEGKTKEQIIAAEKRKLNGIYKKLDEKTKKATESLVNEAAFMGASLYELRTIIAEKGYTLVPLKVYFKGSLVKVSIGLAKGKKLYDKRQDIAKKDMRREAEREFKVRNL